MSDCAARRRLTTATLSDQTNRLATRYIKRHTIDRLNRIDDPLQHARANRKVDFQVAHGQQRLLLVLRSGSAIIDVCTG